MTERAPSSTLKYISDEMHHKLLSYVATRYPNVSVTMFSNDISMDLFVIAPNFGDSQQAYFFKAFLKRAIVGRHGQNLVRSKLSPKFLDILMRMRIEGKQNLFENAISSSGCMN